MENEIEKLNYVLRTLKASVIPGLLISSTLKGQYPGITEDEVFLIEQRLKQDQHIILENISRGRKHAQLTDNGRAFILKGGYEPQEIIKQSKAEIFDSLIDKHNEKKEQLKMETKQKQGKKLLLKLQEISLSIQHCIGVMGSNELAPVLSKLKVLLLNYYSDQHDYYKQFISITKESAYTSDLMGLLSEIMTELELNTEDSDLSHLHPKVKSASAGLFRDGYYSQALFDALKLLIETIKNDYTITDPAGRIKDGKDLMQDVFSPKNPRINLSEDPNEREGLMFLYVGAVTGLRNKYGHKSIKIEKEEALEVLHFISYLFRTYYHHQAK